MISRSLLLCLVLMRMVCITSQAQQMDSAKTSAGVDYQKAARSQVGVDTAYISRVVKNNNGRFFYGTQGTALQYGSIRHSTPSINASVYSNVNDFVGFGLTYKIIDVDLFFSLPATRFVQQDLQNLNQFRLALTYTGRKLTVRGFVSDTKGMIASDPDGRYQSTPDIHHFRAGAQFTYIFNSRRYSYRAAIFQDERQRKTAGSFLLRFEPFYRSLGVGTSLVPTAMDAAATYGDQAGLQYLKAPGILVMPGYGVVITAKDGKFYFAPMILAGGGVAFNFYKGRFGDYAYTTWELSSMVSINGGFNGPRTYFNLAFTGDLNYAPVNPAYFMTTNLRMNITVGYRFANFEKFIPGSF